VPLLLLDLDDTLLDRAAAFRRWAELFLRERGLYGAETLSWIVGVDDGGRSPRQSVLERVRTGLGVRETPQELLAHYQTHFPAAFEPLAPETAAALDDARARGWTVGVVTNGDRIQERKIVLGGVDRHIDGWIASGLVGYAKPDPEIFRIAARRLGGTLDGGWMIGDLPGTDIAGAVAAGLSSVWLHHGREWPEVTFRPTLIAGSVPEAIEGALSADAPAAGAAGP
jgi:putative hydrolase of the HAD superfamily